MLPSAGSKASIDQREVQVSSKALCSHREIRLLCKDLIACLAAVGPKILPSAAWKNQSSPQPPQCIAKLQLTGNSMG